MAPLSLFDRENEMNRTEDMDGIGHHGGIGALLFPHNDD